MFVSETFWVIFKHLWLWVISKLYREKFTRISDESETGEMTANETRRPKSSTTTFFLRLEPIGIDNFLEVNNSIEEL